MSPEVAAGLRRDHPCACGAVAGERCRAYLDGRPLTHVHADRVYKNLFSRKGANTTS